MSKIESILNRGFTWDGSAWDSSPLRRAILLYLLPVAAVVIALAGGLIIARDLQSAPVQGYVVSSSPDCQTEVAARPGGPVVDVFQEATGSRLDSCGQLEPGQEVLYDPATGQQSLGVSNTIGGFIVLPILVLLAGGPSALAWTATVRKRRSQRAES